MKKESLTQKEFLIQHLTEDKSYAEIAEANQVDRKQLSEWWETGTELRARIRRANQLFAGKKKNESFAQFREMGKRGFFEWYDKQPQQCAYCGISEKKLQVLFGEGEDCLRTKRGRGRVLELERKDAENNEYSPENCVLICYLCNNHKSDLISEGERREYFVRNIRRY